MANSAPVSRMVLLGMGVLLAAASVRWRLLGDDGNAWRTVIASDGEGYHAYLARACVPGDTAAWRLREDHRVPAGDRHVIKYMAGAPLMQAPLVGTVHAVRRLAGLPPRMHAPEALAALALTAMLWTLAGLAAVRKLLLSSGMGDGATAWTLLVLLAGTGLAQHTVMSPSMSHPYAFASVALLLLASQRAWQSGSVRWTIAAAGLFGLVVLVRPVNATVMLALPLATMTGGQPAQAWWRKAGRPAALPAALLFLLVTGTQPLLWWLQSGHWLVRPYANEGFNWSAPEVFRSLFGAQKGLFFFWPLLMLSPLGLPLLWKRSRRSAMAWAAHACATVYLTSAWWSWEYGDTYGPRPYLDHLAVAALPIALVFAHGGPLRTVRWLTVPLVLLQLFHSWQYTVGIIHPHDMDREKWKAIFLRSGDEWRGVLGGCYEPPPYAPCGLDTLLVTQAVPGGLGPPWEPGAVITTDGEDRFFAIAPTSPFGPTVRIGPAGLPTGRPFFIETNLRRLEPVPGSSREALVVTTLEGAQGLRVHDAYELNGLPGTSRIRHWRHAYRLQPALPGERLSWYVWQPGSGGFLLDTIELRIRVVRPCP